MAVRHLVTPDRSNFAGAWTPGRYCFGSICRGFYFALCTPDGGLTFRLSEFHTTNIVAVDLYRLADSAWLIPCFLA